MTDDTQQTFSDDTPLSDLTVGEFKVLMRETLLQLLDEREAALQAELDSLQPMTQRPQRPARLTLDDLMNE